MSKTTNSTAKANKARQGTTNREPEFRASWPQSAFQSESDFVRMTGSCFSLQLRLRPEANPRNSPEAVGIDAGESNHDG